MPATTATGLKLDTVASTGIVKQRLTAAETAALTDAPVVRLELSAAELALVEAAAEGVE